MIEEVFIPKALFRLLLFLTGKAIPYELLQVFKVFPIGFYPNTPLKILTFIIYQNPFVINVKTRLDLRLSFTLVSVHRNKFKTTCLAD